MSSLSPRPQEGAAAIKCKTARQYTGSQQREPLLRSPIQKCEQFISQKFVVVNVGICSYIKHRLGMSSNFFSPGLGVGPPPCSVVSGFPIPLEPPQVSIPGFCIILRLERVNQGLVTKCDLNSSCRVYPST